MILLLYYLFHHVQLYFLRYLLNLHFSIHLYLVTLLLLFLDRASFLHFYHMPLICYYLVFLFLHYYNILILLYYHPYLLHNKIFLFLNHTFYHRLHHNQMHLHLIVFLYFQLNQKYVSHLYEVLFLRPFYILLFYSLLLFQLH